MDMDARRRADAAFAKKPARPTDATGAWSEYEADQVAINSNMERLRVERLAREATKGLTTRPRKKVKAGNRFDRSVLLR